MYLANVNMLNTLADLVKACHGYSERLQETDPITTVRTGKDTLLTSKKIDIRKCHAKLFFSIPYTKCSFILKTKTEKQ